MNPPPLLPLARYRLTFRVVDPVRLPAYSGSAWRGVFGRALKQLVCVTRERNCPGCLLYRSCVYPYIFETPPDPAVGKMRKYTAAPHPFVLNPDAEAHGILHAGALLSLGVTLFGNANRQLPYVIHALDRGGQRGIGRGRLTLRRVEQFNGEDDTWNTVYEPGGVLQPEPPAVPAAPPCPSRLTLRLETMLRLKVEGRNVTPESFQFGLLFSSLLRRISMLSAFHTDAPLETDFAGLTRAARGVESMGQDLSWREWTRYSSRQHTTLEMGGLVGRIALDGAQAAPFWPYLWLGQWTHAGKGASMGLGRYRIIETNPQA